MVGAHQPTAHEGRLGVAAMRIGQMIVMRGGGHLIRSLKIRPEGRQVSASFFTQKETKKLLFTVGVGTAVATTPIEQKFFGYFFSKKVTASFLHFVTANAANWFFGIGDESKFGAKLFIV
jgi:hypothetical protein